MALPYDEDYDEMEEGLSPPDGWVPDTNPTYAPDTCEVDDAQAHSDPHSMLLADGGSCYCHHDEAGGFTSDKILVWLYFPVTNKTGYLTAQATVGDLTTAQLLAFISFRNDGDIEYHDGGWQDTGYNYTSGWHKLEIVHDVDNDQFDAWYDDVKIISGGGYYNGNTGFSSVKGVHVGCVATSIWADDVQIGEDPCTISPAQAGPMSGGVTI